MHDQVDWLEHRARQFERIVRLCSSPNQPRTFGARRLATRVDFVVRAGGANMEVVVVFAARVGLHHHGERAVNELHGFAARGRPLGEKRADGSAREYELHVPIRILEQRLEEKPLTLDAKSTERVIEAARRRGVFLLEGYMYRCHPLLAALLERLERGDIGKLLHVRADFGFRAPRDPEGRLFDLALGGGGILDVGGYTTSFARLLAGVAEGKPFAEPLSLTAVGQPRVP